FFKHLRSQSIVHLVIQERANYFVHYFVLVSAFTILAKIEHKTNPKFKKTKPKFAHGICANSTVKLISAQIKEIAALLRKYTARISKEGVINALTRLDDEVMSCEAEHQTQRLTVVALELKSIEQELRDFQGVTSLGKEESYAATIHEEMRRLEAFWLRNRQQELQREANMLQSYMYRLRSLNQQFEQLLDSIWSEKQRPEEYLERSVASTLSLRDALALVSIRLRAAANYAQSSLRSIDEALPAWKLASIGTACADASRLLLRARCFERGARRVLGVQSAPRAARTLRLTLDYIFTDALHDRKYQRATETFIQFKEAMVELVNSINQALRSHKVTIPSFCYHDRLSIAGNCRMCLVEIEGMWKPQIACSLHVAKDIKVWTNTEMTQRAQESVLEFLLVDHPLDCPICDQGGECDLQDLTMKFGNDRTRFTDIHFEGKRAVEDKSLGPLIRAEMTRCIHCTRCIRFASQVCGMDILGTTGRGGEMLVGTYVDKVFLSELSGNVIDLCPVGSLTAIPYMFKARPWEVRQANSIDVTDATGTNIVINHRFDRVLRILPREHDEINQEWLSDKGRWSIDSIELQRLATPMCRSQSHLCPIDWDTALKNVSQLIRSVNPNRIMAIAGPHSNVETLVVAKDFLNMLGCENTFTERGLSFSLIGPDLRASYSLNVNMKDIATADRILLIGTNPRFEAPVLNAWIRQAYVTNECEIFAVGPTCDYNYHVNYIGSTVESLKSARNLFENSCRPLIFVGISQLESYHAAKIMNEINKIMIPSTVPKTWGVINVITLDASFAGALEAGWQPGALDAIDNLCPEVIISLGADDIFYRWREPDKYTMIYVGFQGDKGAELSTFVLPGCSYAESGGVYLNMEARAQHALPAITPPGKARLDWKIFRALAEYCGLCMFYTDRDTLCCRLGQISPNFINLGPYQDKLFGDLIPKLIGPENPSYNENDSICVRMKTIKDYYCSDVYTCNSCTMRTARKAAEENDNIDNLTVVEKDLAEGQRRLREARVNDILNKGLVKLQYNGPL
ncbi:unnamed protein product, partial [Leptidea sinapis]